VTYVIDPCFREQFEIANPSVQYSSVLAEVPREFVGTEEHVTRLVELLSAELKKSFQVGTAHLILCVSCSPLSAKSTISMNRRMTFENGL
jgi:uncharacterized protein (TIGR01615 family)